MARKPDFDLATALASPSFTPGRADAPALVELIVGGDDRAAAALAGLPVAREVIVGRLGAPLDEAARARLVGARGLVARAGEGEATGAILAQLGDPSSRVRRAAIIAAGKIGDASA